MVDMNATFAAMHGYSVKELLGIHYPRLYRRIYVTISRRLCVLRVKGAATCSNSSICGRTVPSFRA